MYPQEAVTEINRCVGKKRMYGIKLWVARRATDPGLNPILEKAVELDVLVLQHAWIKTTGNLPGESFPEDVADLANRHPQARIIMAHLNGIGLRGLEDVAIAQIYLSIHQEEMLRAGWSKLLSRPWGQNGWSSAPMHRSVILVVSWQRSWQPICRKPLNRISSGTMRYDSYRNGQDDACPHQTVK